MSDHVESLQNGQVFISTSEVVEIGEESGVDPRSIVEQLVLAVTVYARSRNLPIEVVCGLPELYFLTLAEQVPPPHPRIIGEA